MSIIPKIKLNKIKKTKPIKKKLIGALQENKNDYNKEGTNNIPLVNKLKQQLFINK